LNEIVVLTAQVGNDGMLSVQLPAEGPKGLVEIIVRAINADAVAAPPESDVDSADLLRLLDTPSAENPLTAEEIANGPDYGAWSHRADIVSGEEFVEKARSERRHSW